MLTTQPGLGQVRAQSLKNPPGSPTRVTGAQGPQPSSAMPGTAAGIRSEVEPLELELTFQYGVQAAQEGTYLFHHSNPIPANFLR